MMTSKRCAGPISSDVTDGCSCGYQPASFPITQNGIRLAVVVAARGSMLGRSLLCLWRVGWVGLMAHKRRGGVMKSLEACGSLGVHT